MEFEILIPTTERDIAYSLIDYADGIMEQGFTAAKKLAKEIAKAKYWEAVDCECTNRQEFWRVVLVCFDDIESFKPSPNKPPIT